MQNIPARPVLQGHLPNTSPGSKASARGSPSATGSRAPMGSEDQVREDSKPTVFMMPRIQGKDTVGPADLLQK